LYQRWGGGVQMEEQMASLAEYSVNSSSRSSLLYQRWGGAIDFL
jgi:hypothetical protein